MNRVTKLLAALLLSLPVTALAGRPNVVLILADDLGWRDLGVTGSDFYETPRLDGLFASGVHFKRAYASCQVCSPTRASLMTGKAPPRHGITTWIGDKSGADWKRNTPLLPADYVWSLPHEDVTVAEAFRDAGYRTFFAGKWHLGGEGSLPTDHGFDVNKGGHHRGSPPGGYFSPYNNPHLEDGPPGEHLPLRLASETASFIREQKDAPFFAMLSFYSVHGPLQTTRERWEANRSQLLARSTLAERFLFDRRLAVRQRQDQPVYAGMVEAMDDAVGAVLDAIEYQGLREKTIVVFTSDNGGVASGDGFATSNLPLRGGKGRQWEGGLRVPLAIAWPGAIEAGQTANAPAITTDIYPTLTALASLPQRPEQHMDGVDLSPAMRGEPTPSRSLYWHYPHYGNQGGEPSSVVVDGDWKLIRYHEDGRQELYRLGEDQGEQRDVAAKHTDRLASLSDQLTNWLRDVGATMPATNPSFDEVAWEAQLRRNAVAGKRRLEERAAAVLDADYTPNADWWGSAPTAE